MLFGKDKDRVMIEIPDNNPSCSRAPTHPPGTRTIFSFQGGWSRASLAQPGRPALPPSEAGQDLPGPT